MTLDQGGEQKAENPFKFKHHYITGAIDSDILAQIFQAIQEKRSVILETVNRKKHQIFQTTVVPLKVFVSVQNGRQYVMAYIPRNGRITAYRLDRILKISLKEKNANFELYRARLEKMKEHLWGVSTQSRSGARMETVEFTVCYGKDEPHIHQRLEREKRCGQVEKLNDYSSRFYAEVYDATELIPWIRTFICRITEIHFSDPVIEADFQKDLAAMYDLYGIEGGDPQ